jgi:hypothetical protein
MSGYAQLESSFFPDFSLWMITERTGWRSPFFGVNFLWDYTYLWLRGPRTPQPQGVSFTERMWLVPIPVGIVTVASHMYNYKCVSKANISIN